MAIPITPNQELILILVGIMKNKIIIVIEAKYKNVIKAILNIAIKTAISLFPTRT